MATLYDDIFEMFLNENDEYDLKMLAEDTLYKKLYNYLKVGMGILDKRVYLDLNNRVDPIFNSYNLMGNGTNELPINLNWQQGMNINVLINNEELDSNKYLYDTVLNKFIFDTTYNSTVEIYIGTYTEGKFNEDINYTVMNILKTIMQFCHVNYKQYKENLLELQIYGKDFKLPSSANHLSTIIDLTENQKKYIDRLIIDYNYYHGSKTVYDRMKGV